MDVIPGGRRESSGSFRPVLFHPCGRSQRRAMRRPSFSKHPPSIVLRLNGSREKEEDLVKSRPRRLNFFSLSPSFSTFLRSYKFRKLTDPRTGRGNGSYTRNIFITRIRFDPRFDGISLRLLGKIFTIGISSLDVRRKRGLFGELHLG